MKKQLTLLSFLLFLMSIRAQKPILQYPQDSAIWKMVTCQQRSPAEAYKRVVLGDTVINGKTFKGIYSLGVGVDTYDTQWGGEYEVYSNSYDTVPTYIGGIRTDENNHPWIITTNNEEYDIFTDTTYSAGDTIQVDTSDVHYVDSDNNATLLGFHGIAPRWFVLEDKGSFYTPDKGTPFIVDSVIQETLSNYTLLTYRVIHGNDTITHTFGVGSSSIKGFYDSAWDSTAYFRTGLYSHCRKNSAGTGVELCEGMTEGIIDNVMENKNYSLELYPNPVTNILRIRTQNYVAEDFRVFDITGRPVMSGSIDGYQSAVNTTLLSSGMYLLQLNTTGQTFRFLKE